MTGEVRTVSSGRFALDGGSMFGIVPKVVWEKAIPADNKNRIPLAARGLLVRRGGRTVVIEAGLGVLIGPREREIYAIDHTEHTLLSSLAEAGVSPSEVTDVVITHLHFDHCSALIIEGDGGRPALAFPAAVHHVQRRNWEWANGSPRRDAEGYLRWTFEPLAAGDRLRLLDGRAEIAPGVTCRPAEGHTFGHQVVQVEADGRVYCFTGDLVPTSAHIPLLFTMAYDLEPLVVLENKTKLLNEAAAEGHVLVFTHDPFIPACTLAREKGRIVKGDAVDL